MAEDIRDALLEYQVGGEKSHAVVVTNTGTLIQQTVQQRAVYDQNCKLIVSTELVICANISNGENCP